MLRMCVQVKLPLGSGSTYRYMSIHITHFLIQIKSDIGHVLILLWKVEHFLRVFVSRFSSYFPCFLSSYYFGIDNLLIPIVSSRKSGKLSRRIGNNLVHEIRTLDNSFSKFCFHCCSRKTHFSFFVIWFPVSTKHSYRIFFFLQNEN